ncbi:MAG: N-methylhydantoinase B [Planctomycetota bacterium]|jgi:N-methylhydantoinase B
MTRSSPRSGSQSQSRARANSTARTRSNRRAKSDAKQSATQRQGSFDPVRLDVFQHLFASVCEEMGAALMRSSFSPNVRERRDLSCALFDSRGRMIGQAAHLPVHLGATPLSVAAAIKATPMEPGDAVVLNDPYNGGTHLPDLSIVSPVFISGEKTPRFYVANRAHHADVGGAAPGSMAPALDVHGEGLRLPPIRLVKGGEIDRELLGVILANMRVPHEREGDLLAQWSANRVGEARLLAMAEEHGAATLERYADGLLRWTERLTQALVRGILSGGVGSGEVRFEDAVELGTPAGASDQGLSNDAWIRLRLRAGGKRLVFDFTETDDQVAGGLNATRAVTVAAVSYALRLFLPEGTPTNGGVLRPVDILTRSGSLVDAEYPAGVAAGNVETSQRLCDVIFGALAQVLPERVPAASAGTMSNITVGGLDPGTGQAYAYYETNAGGAGGGPGGPGAHALQTHMTNTRNTPIEELELAHPVRVLAQGVRRGSGGAGRHPGGDGVTRHLRFLAPAHLARISDRQRRGPWGLRGGLAGKPGRARLRLKPGGPWTQLPGTAVRDVEVGAELRFETPGGGGWGDDSLLS